MHRSPTISVLGRKSSNNKKDDDPFLDVYYSGEEEERYIANSTTTTIPMNANRAKQRSSSFRCSNHGERDSDVSRTMLHSETDDHRNDTPLSWQPNSVESSSSKGKPTIQDLTETDLTETTFYNYNTSSSSSSSSAHFVVEWKGDESLSNLIDRLREVNGNADDNRFRQQGDSLQQQPVLLGLSEMTRLLHEANYCCDEQRKDGRPYEVQEEEKGEVSLHHAVTITSDTVQKQDEPEPELWSCCRVDTTHSLTATTATTVDDLIARLSAVNHPVSKLQVMLGRTNNNNNNSSTLLSVEEMTRILHTINQHPSTTTTVNVCNSDPSPRKVETMMQPRDDGSCRSVYSSCSFSPGSSLASSSLSTAKRHWDGVQPVRRAKSADLCCCDGASSPPRTRHTKRILHPTCRSLITYMDDARRSTVEIFGKLDISSNTKKNNNNDHDDDDISLSVSELFVEAVCSHEDDTENDDGFTLQSVRVSSCGSSVTWYEGLDIDEITVQQNNDELFLFDNVEEFLPEIGGSDDGVWSTYS